MKIWAEYWIVGGQEERPIAALQHSVTGRPVGRHIAVGETRRIVTHPAVAALDDDISKPSHLSYQSRVDVIATDGAVFLEGAALKISTLRLLAIRASSFCAPL